MGVSNAERGAKEDNSLREDGDDGTDDRRTSRTKEKHVAHCSPTPGSVCIQCSTLIRWKLIFCNTPAIPFCSIPFHGIARCKPFARSLASLVSRNRMRELSAGSTMVGAPRIHFSLFSRFTFREILVSRRCPAAVCILDPASCRPLENRKRALHDDFSSQG